MLRMSASRSDLPLLVILRGWSVGGKITLRGSPSLHLIKGSFDIAQQILTRLHFCDILEPLFTARLNKCSGTYDVSQRHFFTRCINDKELSLIHI